MHVRTCMRTSILCHAYGTCVYILVGVLIIYINCGFKFMNIINLSAQAMNYYKKDNHYIVLAAALFYS